MPELPELPSPPEAPARFICQLEYDPLPTVVDGVPKDKRPVPVLYEVI